MSVVAISNDTFAVCIGNEDVRIWSSFESKTDAKDQQARQVWQVVAALNYRDLKAKQLVANVRLRLSNMNSHSIKKDETRGKTASCLAVLHEGGWVSFWTQDSWQLAYQFRLDSAKITKIVFESSCRFLAALTSTGSVEVWRLKGMDARYDWGL